ncbi:MAG: hypothetical protein Q4C49_02615 [Bacillota bacterium]|nr:hypothetical protein [Bacillota bacterium]
MQLKKIILFSLSIFLLCGCANKITYENTIAQLSEDASTNKQAYTLIHDSIEKLNELDSYSYTINNLSYNPIFEYPMRIEQAKYKIQNEQEKYSGVGLIKTFQTDFSMEDESDKAVNTYSFENSKTNQKMTDEYSNGFACQIDCTTTIDKDNPSHRYLLSPKEELFNSFIGEKYGFYEAVSLAEYEQSADLKEIYKTKKNYLQSFINEKIDTWQDTVIYLEEEQTKIYYKVEIELGESYLQNVLSKLTDEDDCQTIQKQLSGDMPFIQKIQREDTITIDENGFLSSREQNYTIFTSENKTYSYQSEDVIDITPVYSYVFSYNEISVNEYTELLSGTYILQNEYGSERRLVFSNTTVIIEEAERSQFGTYTLKDGQLKIIILDFSGNVLCTEKYKVSSDYQFLIDENNNYYNYYSPPIEEEEEYFEEPGEEEIIEEDSDNIIEDIPDEIPDVEETEKGELQ